MDIPQLPTDNLYKFKALTGLALLLICLLFPFSKLTELKLQSIDYGCKIKQLSVEVKNLEKTVNRLERDKTVSDQQITEANNQRIQLNIKMIESDSVSEKLNYSLKRFNELMFFAILGLFVGLYLSVKGFREWQHRVQTPQDDLIMLQIETLRQTNTKPLPTEEPQ